MFTKEKEIHNIMLRNIKDLYQRISDLEIGGFNAPVKAFSDGREFLLKDIILKNNDLDGTYCCIELKAKESSQRQELLSLINFFEENFKANKNNVDKELELKAIQGIERIKSLLQNNS